MAANTVTEALKYAIAGKAEMLSYADSLEGDAYMRYPARYRDCLESVKLWSKGNTVFAKVTSENESFDYCAAEILDGISLTDALFDRALITINGREASITFV